MAKCTRCPRDAVEGQKRCLDCLAKARAWRLKSRLADPERYRQRCKKANATPAHVKSVKKYHAKHKEELAAWRKEYFREWTKRNAERSLLRDRLNAAIERGTIIRPTKCYACPKEGKVSPLLIYKTLKSIKFYCPSCLQTEAYKSRRK